MFFFAIFRCGAHFISELRRHGWTFAGPSEKATAKAVACLMSFAHITCYCVFAECGQI